MPKSRLNFAVISSGSRECKSYLYFKPLYSRENLAIIKPYSLILGTAAWRGRRAGQANAQFSYCWPRLPWALQGLKLTKITIKPYFIPMQYIVMTSLSPFFMHREWRGKKSFTTQVGRDVGKMGRISFSADLCPKTPYTKSCVEGRENLGQQKVQTAQLFFIFTALGPRWRWDPQPQPDPQPPKHEGRQRPSKPQVGRGVPLALFNHYRTGCLQKCIRVKALSIQYVRCLNPVTFFRRLFVAFSVL